MEKTNLLGNFAVKTDVEKARLEIKELKLKHMENETKLKFKPQSIERAFKVYEAQQIGASNETIVKALFTEKQIENIKKLQE